MEEGGISHAETQRLRGKGRGLGFVLSEGRGVIYDVVRCNETPEFWVAATIDDRMLR